MQTSHLLHFHSNGSAVSKDGENIIRQKRKTKEDLKKDGIELKKTEKCD